MCTKKRTLCRRINSPRDVMRNSMAVFSSINGCVQTLLSLVGVRRLKSECKVGRNHHLAAGLLAISPVLLLIHQREAARRRVHETRHSAESCLGAIRNPPVEGVGTDRIREKHVLQSQVARRDFRKKTKDQLVFSRLNCQ